MRWLPTTYAKKGRTVKLKRSDGSWDDGWTVHAVYGTMDEDAARLKSRDHTKQRKASDT